MNNFYELSAQSKLEILSKMYMCRFFEEKLDELFAEKLMHGTTHLAIGQEAGQVGLCRALHEDDWIISTHRSHGFFLAKGGSPKALMAEMFGLQTGACKGLGGSMHLTDEEHGIMGSTSIVGGSAPLAVGMAFAMKYKKENGISVGIFGDGASNQGMVLEALNLSSVWKSPVLFYCENNLYGMSTPCAKMVAGDIYKRAESFGIKSERIDGNDIAAVFEAVQRARNYITEHGEPYFIEAMTYRFCGHSKSDKRIYRDEKEELLWRQRCPIKLYEAYIIENNIADNTAIDGIKQKVREEIDQITAECITEKENCLSLEKAMAYTYPA